MVDLAHDEWLSELNSLQEASGEGDGLTVAEICDRMKRGERWVRRQLMKAKGQGRLARNQVLRENLAGRMAWCTLFKVLPAKPGQPIDGEPVPGRSNCRIYVENHDGCKL